MNALPFTLAGEPLLALHSGALVLPGVRLLCVSDLHLGKSDRIARRSGTMLPPYETRATLDRLSDAIEQTDPRIVLCLGDSFDDLAAADSLAPEDRATLLRLQSGCEWIWIEGNHDPGPVDLGGAHLASYTAGRLTFRHIATPGATGEVSGHYHPKLALPGTGWRPCFLFDDDRLILPAFGAYTGGLPATDPALRALLGARARAIVTGRRALLTALPPARYSDGNGSGPGPAAMTPRDSSRRR
jgi:DNA ligase-associated metallophosphoesterase